MAVATRTISSLSAPFTQAQLSTALQAAFVNAGFTSLFDSFTSGTDLVLVYAFVVDGAKTFGTTYLRVRITNTFIINQALYSTWNATTHTGGNSSTEVAYSTLVSTTSVTFNALNASGEVRLILATQGALFLPLGMIAPINRRSSWDLKDWNWGHIFISSTMLILRSSGLNQYSNAENDIALAGSTRLATANVQDNERDILSGLILLNQSN
ncbi:hypothetical protein LC653_40275 [Nostoc sp. CHAB 5784]|uniref:hypothetical protein n=1 Tax=Nostoc mirabile TaxID=2907820 RepID=UPI001E40828F|nr:hypothetical protein [Nostoc mirabile]MCC5669881.1 hypothetical protein [Nostoc mirabile CHAB5784]